MHSGHIRMCTTCTFIKHISNIIKCIFQLTRKLCVKINLFIKGDQIRISVIKSVIAEQYIFTPIHSRQQYNSYFEVEKCLYTLLYIVMIL